MVNGELSDGMNSPSEDTGQGIQLLVKHVLSWCHIGAVGISQLIEKIKAKVGKREDAEDYEALERIIQSNNFKNLMEVSFVMARS